MQLQLTIRLPAPLLKNIAKTARSSGLKRSDIVRLALQKFFHATPPEDISAQSAHNDALSFLGKIETGIPDLGSRHREHLMRKMRNAQESRLKPTM